MPLDCILCQMHPTHISTSYFSGIHLNFILPSSLWSRHSSVGITTCYGLDSRSSIPGWGKKFFPIPQRPDRLRDSPSLTSIKYQRHFPRGQCGRRVKLTIPLLHSPIRLHGMVLNWLSTGTTAAFYQHFIFASVFCSFMLCAKPISFFWMLSPGKSSSCNRCPCVISPAVYSYKPSKKKLVLISVL
jgi:hypothetical protein